MNSCTLYAPACTVQFALDHYEPAMTGGVLRQQDFHVELLSDEREMGDTIHKTPILGMANAWDPAKRNTWSDDPVIQRGLKSWQAFWGTVRSPREVTEAHPVEQLVY